MGTRGFPHIPGGVEKHCEELYPRLVELGCDVTALVRTPYIPKASNVTGYKGVKFIPLWCPKKKAVEAFLHTLFGVIKAAGLSPDIVHFHAVGPSLFTPLARALRLKTVMTHHGPDYERDRWGRTAKGVLRLGERCGVLYGDRVISISRGIQRLVKGKYGRDSVFIPNGVNIPERRPPGEELKRFDLLPGGYVFTALRFVPEKGIHDLINAYKEITRPLFKLVIAGGADHASDYSRKIEDLARAVKGVTLTGFVTGERLGELYSNAGLFVLPSYYEGLPIALLEAMSYGLPVLVSDIAQHREIPLADFRYFRAGDVKDLKAAMLERFSEGISSVENAKNIGLLEHDYNWDKIARATLETYKEVMGNR